VTITSQIQKVRILVELVKDGSGAVLDIGRGEYGDGVLRESFGKLDASVVVFLRRDTGRDYHSSTRSLPSHIEGCNRTFSGLEQMRMRLM
jgi:hypothetical protein